MHIDWSKALWLMGAVLCFTVGTTAIQTRTQCYSTNHGRVQGNIRAQVLREFLTDAANARESSAKHTTGAESKNNLATAKRYRALRARVKDLPPSNCYW